MSRYAPTRKEFEEEALSSHCRAESEEGDKRRADFMRQATDIEEGMQAHTGKNYDSHCRHPETLNSALDVDEDLHFDALNDEEFQF